MQISLNNQGRKIEDKLLRHSALAKHHYKKSLSPNFEKKSLALFVSFLRHRKDHLVCEPALSRCEDMFACT